MAYRRTVITDQQVSEALAENARHSGGLWGLSVPGGGWHWYSEDLARTIVKACLILGVGVTGTVTGEAWLIIAERLAAIEARLDAAGIA